LRSALIFISLFIFTVWNFTRSTGLEDAKSAEARAIQSADQRQWATAVSLGMEHLRRQPWSREARLVVARGLSKLDHPDLAEPYYQQSRPLELSDEHTRAYAILRANDRDRAIAHYLAILDRVPEDIASLRILAGIYMSQSRWTDALAIARRLEAIPGAAALGHQISASVHHEEHDADLAAAQFARVLERDPELSFLPEDAQRVFWQSYATDLLHTGRVQEARRIAEEGLERFALADLWTIKAQAEQELGMFDEAKQSCKSALRLDPDHAIAWREQGKISLQERRVRDAIPSLVRARELVPFDYQTLFSLMTAYRLTGQTDEARELNQLVERVRDLAPPSRRGMGSALPSAPVEEVSTVPSREPSILNGTHQEKRVP
jgi:tetratricopeptide (TPR) repeat protein